MNREYDHGSSDQVEFFIGEEIENTSCHGLTTLFVVGLKSWDEIKNNLVTKVSHVYLGANQSFRYSSKDIEDWNQLIIAILSQKYHVTLDFDVSDYQNLMPYLAEWSKSNFFGANISVKLPNIIRLNSNTCIKIDDIDFAATNVGVWVHGLTDLTMVGSPEFTSWDQYKNDKVIK